MPLEKSNPMQIQQVALKNPQKSNELKQLIKVKKHAKPKNLFHKKPVKKLIRSQASRMATYLTKYNPRVLRGSLTSEKN